jgi:hypothetical protein
MAVRPRSACLKLKYPPPPKKRENENEKEKKKRKKEKKKKVIVKSNLPCIRISVVPLPGHG